MTEAYINGPRGYGIDQPGFAFDLRPGKNPSDWIFDHTYAWPVPHGPRPITLIPALIHEEWETRQEDSGAFARYKMNNFILAQGQVKEYTRLHAKDHVIWTKGDPTTPTEIISRAPLGLNHGLSLHFAASGSQLTNKRVMEVTFGHPDLKKALRLAIFENGRGYLTRGNALNPAPEDQLAEGSLVPNRWGNILNRWVRLFILPHGRNRLLISSSTGEGFIWENSLIPRITPRSFEKSHANSVDTLLAPVIKPATYRIKTIPSVAMQPRPLAYHGLLDSTGYYGTIQPKHKELLSVAGVPIDTGLLQHVPTLDHWEDTQDHAYGFDFPTVDLKGNAKALNPTLKLRRPKKIDQDVYKSPQLYRHEVRQPTTSKTKIDEKVAIGQDIISFRHDHSEETLTGNIELRYAEDHTAFHRKFNIPFQWTEDGHVFIQSYLVSPKLRIQGRSNAFLSFDLTDEMKFLNNARVLDATRMDGLAIDDAVKSLLIGVGFPADGSMWVIDPIGTTINGEKTQKTSKGEADSDPTNLADVFKSVGEWLRYLVDTYTSSGEYPGKWVFGFAPFLNTDTGLYQYKFYFRDPKVLAAIPPIKTWFPEYSLAETPPDESTGATYLTSYKSIYTEWSEEIIEPEGNALLVVGVSQELNEDGGKDENTGEEIDGNAITKSITYPSSMDSHLPIAEWNSDHIGWRQQIVVKDGALNTEEKVVEAAWRLAFRGFRSRARATMKAEWEPVIKQYDRVRVWQPKVPMIDPDDLSNPGNYDVHIWSVIGFDVTHVQDGEHEGVYKTRPATYVLERWLT